MALVSIKKNEIRIALIRYHREIIDLLEKYPNSYRIHEFEGELEELCNEIKKDMRNSDNKNNIRKALKGARRQIIQAAKNSIKGKKIDSKTFFANYFKGIPLDSKSLSEAPYDVVIEIEPGYTVSWVFCPSQFESINNSEIMNQVENEFQKKCSRVITKYSVHTEKADLIEFQSEEPTSISPVISETAEQNDESSESADEPISEDDVSTDDEHPKLEYIGRVQFDKKHQMLLKEDHVHDQIHGYIKEENASDVLPNDILVLESREKDTIVLASVVKLEVNRQHTATNFDSYSELGVKVLFRPLLEKTEDYEGKPRPIDLSGYQVRDPTPNEAALVTHMPKSGIPIGKLPFRKGDIDCYFPFDPNSENLHDTLYQSVFIAGVQGSGKTIGLKYLIQAISSYRKIDYEKRPAVIILDGENSFTKFTPLEDMNQESQEFLTKHDIGSVTPQVFTLSENTELSDSTLSLQNLSYMDLMYLIPELEAKTEGILLQILKLTFEMIKGQHEELTIDNIRHTAMSNARGSNLIHPSQLPAIGRALQSVELDMFNQLGKTELSSSLLFEPGTVSVINVHNLDKTRRRIVALYIQQMLNKFKMETSNKYPGVILVIDEAEQLFPNKPTKRERDFVERIAERMEDVTNRGRKRYYGLFIVSHLPSEISSRVVALANTQMAFRCSGANTWISRVFGKEYVEEINDLPLGMCRIKVNVSTQHQKSVNAKIRMLNVEKEE